MVEGINVFEKGKRIAIFNKENGQLSDNAVLSMFNDSQNNVWIGTYLGGVNCYNNKSQAVQANCSGRKKANSIFVASSKTYIITSGLE